MIDNVRDDIAHRAETARNELDSLMWLIRMAVMGTVVAAVWSELRKPQEQRTWHGKVAGFIPYDFRIPSLDTLRQAYWNPHSPKLFTDRPLGVGWAINIPTALRRLGVHTELTKGR